jgi:hypothetical protein
VGLEEGERTKLKVSKAVFDKPEGTLERVKGTKRKNIYNLIILLCRLMYLSRGLLPGQGQPLYTRRCL